MAGGGAQRLTRPRCGAAWRFAGLAGTVVFESCSNARTIEPRRPIRRASCLKRLPTRSATRSPRRCSNTSISLRPWLRKCVAGSTPGRAAEIRWATRNAAPRRRGALELRRRQQLLRGDRRLVFLAAGPHSDRTPTAPTKARSVWVIAPKLPLTTRLSVCSPRWSGCTAPADVGEQAGGVAQAAVLLGLAQLHDAGEAVGPGDQLAGVARRARQQLVELLGRADQSILVALGLGDSFS